MTRAELKQFHDELRAAIALGVPLEVHRGTKKLTASQLEQFELHLNQSGSSFDQKRFLDGQTNDLPPRYVAALQTFAQTKKMVPILEGLSWRVVHAKKVARILRSAIVYLSMLMLVACVGLLVFLFKVFPQFRDIDASTNIQSSASTEVEGLAILNWLPTLLIVFSAILAILFVWVVLLGGAKNLIRIFGGTKYLNSIAKSKLLSAIGLLNNSGMSPSESVAIGCQLFGVNETIGQELRSLADKPGNMDQTSTLALYYARNAQRRIFNMKTATRTAMVTFIGGAITLCYGLAIYSPIINLLYKLLATATLVATGTN